MRGEKGGEMKVGREGGRCRAESEERKEGKSGKRGKKGWSETEAMKWEEKEEKGRGKKEALNRKG